MWGNVLMSARLCILKSETELKKVVVLNPLAEKFCVIKELVNRTG